MVMCTVGDSSTLMIGEKWMFIRGKWSEGWMCGDLEENRKGNSIDQQTDSKPVDPTLRGPFYALLERLRARRVERSHWRKGAPWGGFYITVRVKKLEVLNTSQYELYFRTQDWIQDQRLVSQIRRRILFWSGSSKVC